MRIALQLFVDLPMCTALQFYPEMRIKCISTSCFRSAIDAGRTERVIELLKLGLPIVVDSDGQTALHLAASAGHLEMVEALIQAGCDVGIQDFVSRSIANIIFLSTQEGFTVV